MSKPPTSPNRKASCPPTSLSPAVSVVHQPAMPSGVATAR